MQSTEDSALRVMEKDAQPEPRFPEGQNMTMVAGKGREAEEVRRNRSKTICESDIKKRGHK